MNAENLISNDSKDDIKNVLGIIVFFVAFLSVFFKVLAILLDKYI